MLDVNNVEWLRAPVAKALSRLRKRKQRFSALVLDPPRAGAKELIELIVGLDAARLLYVSCNPATLARDLSALHDHGYVLQTVQPVDFFPQTFHVECLALLTRA